MSIPNDRYFNSIYPTNNSNHDELFNTSKVDVANSDGVIICPQKRVAILNGGVLWTTAFVPPGGTTKAWFSFRVSQINREDRAGGFPAAPAMLEDFNPSTHAPLLDESSFGGCSVFMTDNVGGSPVPLNFRAETTVTPTNPYRLNFSNATGSILYLQNWYLYLK